MLPWQHLIHDNPEVLKTYGRSSEMSIIWEKMLNYTHYHVCSITYTLHMSKHIFIWDILPNAFLNFIETDVSAVTSKHTCATLIISYRKTALHICHQARFVQRRAHLWVYKDKHKIALISVQILFLNSFNYYTL